MTPAPDAFSDAALTAYQVARARGLDHEQGVRQAVHLLSVLRQLRAGYVRRPAGFPQCVVLCRVCDYRIVLVVRVGHRRDIYG